MSTKSVTATIEQASDKVKQLLIQYVVSNLLSKILLPVIIGGIICVIIYFKIFYNYRIRKFNIFAHLSDLDSQVTEFVQELTTHIFTLIQMNKTDVDKMTIQRSMFDSNYTKIKKIVYSILDVDSTEKLNEKLDHYKERLEEHLLSVFAQNRNKNGTGTPDKHFLTFQLMNILNSTFGWHGCDSTDACNDLLKHLNDCLFDENFTLFYKRAKKKASRSSYTNYTYVPPKSKIEAIRSISGYKTITDMNSTFNTMNILNYLDTNLGGSHDYFDIIRTHIEDTDNVINSKLSNPKSSLEVQDVNKINENILLKKIECYQDIWKEFNKRSKADVDDDVQKMNFEICKRYFETYYRLENIGTLDQNTDINMLLNSSINKHVVSNDQYHAFETMLYGFENNNGPGLVLSNDDDTVPTILNKYKYALMLIDFKDNFKVIQQAYVHRGNKELIQKLIDFSDAFVRLPLLMGKDFPMILYYDTNRIADIQRLNTYYEKQFAEMLQRLITHGVERLNIVKYWNGLTKPTMDTSLLLNAFSDDNPIKPILETIISKLIQPFRGLLSDARKDPIKLFESIYDTLTQTEQFKNYVERKNKQNEKKKDVIESFLSPSSIGKAIGKAVTSPLKTIFKPVFDFVNVAMQIIMFIIDIITNPFKVVAFILSIIVFCLILVVSLFDIQPLYALTSIIAYIVITIGVSITISTYIFGIVYLIIIWSLDQLTRGYIYVTLYRFIFAEENDVRNWKNTPSYEMDNKVSRSFVVSACDTCAQNYIPSDLGTIFPLCKRLPHYLPTYSYHANIEKLKENGTITGLLEPEQYYPRNIPAFTQLSARQKRNLIKHANKTAAIYHKNVQTNLKEYNELTKTTCRNLQTHGHELSAKKRQQLEKLCYSNFCRNGNTNSFCYKLNPQANLNEISMTPVVHYLHLIMWAIVIIIITHLIFLTIKQT